MASCTTYSTVSDPDLDSHNNAVDKIARSVRYFYENKIAWRNYHGSTNSTRATTRESKKIVDTSSLNKVIKVDRYSRTALVEPNVPMDKLVQATLPYDLIPPVVPEFPGITVGGSYSGTAGESSSFKHGMFDRTINWLEIILADGSIIRASPDENGDLFYGAVGAFGTLGVAILFEIRLQPTGPYVEVTYLPITSASEGIELIQKCSKEQPFDYIDGILFSRTSGVVCLGRTTQDRNAHPIRRFTRARDPWFYLHAQTCAAAKAAGPVTELVPLYDYLFRYDRGAFWMGYWAFKMFATPFNRATRILLDPLMHTRKMYQALHNAGTGQHMIIQDLAIPVDSAAEFVDYVDENFGIHPLWLCPLRADSKAPFHTYANSPHLLINVGVWGPGRGYRPSDHERFVSDNRKLERKVKELGGLKWLYAHNYYTEEEFWGIYDRSGYEVLRRKYRAETLPELWEKVAEKRERRRQPETPVRGVLKTILGIDGLVKK